MKVFETDDIFNVSVTIRLLQVSSLRGTIQFAQLFSNTQFIDYDVFGGDRAMYPKGD